MFIWADNEIYDELLNVYPQNWGGMGLAFIKEDVFGFLIKDQEMAGEEITFNYRDRQVQADKCEGSGEEIKSGQRLFAYRKNPGLAWTTPQDCYVSHAQVGKVGVDFQFCGWAKEDAAETDPTVLMNFDGTRPEIGY